MQSYLETRARLETYFDRTAADTWARLTSDAPVSRIRRTVRAGRDEMRAHLLAMLPADLQGARVLDAGAGAGQLSHALAARGAHVVAADLSAALLDVAAARMPEELAGRIEFCQGDYLDVGLGQFDFVVAMDSLIHYRTTDIALALDQLSARTASAIAFTVAPKTPALTAMWWAGQLFPRSDRSPAIVPQSAQALRHALGMRGEALHVGPRVTSGFYISQAMELRL